MTIEQQMIIKQQILIEQQLIIEKNDNQMISEQQMSILQKAINSISEIYDNITWNESTI